MNYTEIYTQIIERARARELKTYTESHHILPASLFNSKRKSKIANRAENLVNLTPKEFVIERVYKFRKYCCKACYLADVKREKTYKTCECCGKEFDPKYNKTARFCSQSCSRSRNKLIISSK